MPLMKTIMDYHLASIYKQYLLIFKKKIIFYIILNKQNIKKLLIKHKKFIYLKN